MRILLINPPDGGGIYSKFSSVAPLIPPLGLLYIAAVLEEKEHNISLIDCPVEKLSIENLIVRIKSISPDIVGVTSTTASFKSAKEVLNAVKQLYSNIVTIMGGPHISALLEQTLEECKDLDIGVIGEGEKTIVDLCKAIENRESLDNVRGIIFRGKNRIIRTKNPELIENLDDLPFPARHLLKDLRLYYHTPFRGKGLTTTMITSRGCPYNCHFCDQSVFGRKWRAFSPIYVVSEMKYLKKTYGVEYISFEDDDFAIDKDRVIEICRLLIEDKVNIKWGCSLRATNLDEKLLFWMKKAGCWNIYLGMESASQRVLDYLNKRAILEQIKKTVELIKRHKINVYGSFMLGIPTETKEELEKTIEFAISLPLNGVSFFLFTPYPNTKLYGECLKHGRIDERWETFSGHPVSAPYVDDNFTTKYLLRKQREAYRRFYLRPRYIITHLNRIFDTHFLKTLSRGWTLFTRV